MLHRMGTKILQFLYKILHKICHIIENLNKSSGIPLLSIIFLIFGKEVVPKSIPLRTVVDD